MFRAEVSVMLFYRYGREDDCARIIIIVRKIHTYATTHSYYYNFHRLLSPYHGGISIQVSALSFQQSSIRSVICAMRMGHPGGKLSIVRSRIRWDTGMCGA